MHKISPTNYTSLIIHHCCNLSPLQVKARAKKGASKASKKKKPSKSKGKKASFRRGGKQQPKVATGMGCPEVGYPEQIRGSFFNSKNACYSTSYQIALRVCGPSGKDSFNLGPRNCPSIGVPWLWPEGVAHVCPAAAKPKTPWLALLHCEYGCAGCQIQWDVWSSCWCVVAKKGIPGQEMWPVWKNWSRILEQDWQCKACLGRGYGQSTLWQRVVRDPWEIFETCGFSTVMNTVGLSWT